MKCYSPFQCCIELLHRQQLSSLSLDFVIILNLPVPSNRSNVLVLKKVDFGARPPGLILSPPLTGGLTFASYISVLQFPHSIKWK